MSLVAGLVAIGVLLVSCSSKVRNVGNADDGSGGAGTEGGVVGGEGNMTSQGATLDAGSATATVDAGGASAGGASSGGASSGSTGSSGAGTASVGGASASVGGTGGGTGECAQAYRCAPDVPEDWLGPIIASVSETTRPECPASFPTRLFDAGSQVSNEGDCECNCEADIECPPLRIGEFPETVCRGERFNEWVLPNSCTPAAAAAYSTQVTVPRSVTCSGTVESTLVPSTFGFIHRACGGGEAAGHCDGGTCFPIPPGDFPVEHCIYREGPYPCPSSYPNKTSLYDDIEDTRNCQSVCQCQDSGTGYCSAIVTFTAPACETVIDTEEVRSTDTRCFTFNGGFEATEPEFTETSSPCLGEQVHPTGTVNGVGGITLCCAD